MADGLARNRPAAADSPLLEALMELARVAIAVRRERNERRAKITVVRGGRAA